jgi:hypothetical protein
MRAAARFELIAGARTFVPVVCGEAGWGVILHALFDDLLLEASYDGLHSRGVVIDSSPVQAAGTAGALGECVRRKQDVWQWTMRFSSSSTSS